MNGRSPKPSMAALKLRAHLVTKCTAGKILVRSLLYQYMTAVKPVQSVMLSRPITISAPIAGIATLPIPGKGRHSTIPESEATPPPLWPAHYVIRTAIQAHHARVKVVIDKQEAMATFSVNATAAVLTDGKHFALLC